MRLERNFAIQAAGSGSWSAATVCAASAPRSNADSIRGRFSPNSCVNPSLVKPRLTPIHSSWLAPPYAVRCATRRSRSFTVRVVVTRAIRRRLAMSLNRRASVILKNKNSSAFFCIPVSRSPWMSCICSGNAITPVQFPLGFHSSAMWPEITRPRFGSRRRSGKGRIAMLTQTSGMRRTSRRRR